MSVTTAMTHGGPHSPDTLTNLYLGHIMSQVMNKGILDPNAFAQVQKNVANVLRAAHDDMQKKFRADLDKKGTVQPDRYTKDVDATLNKVLEVIRSSVYAPALKDPETEPSIKELVYRQFATSLDIEKQWHAKR